MGIKRGGSLDRIMCVSQRKDLLDAVWAIRHDVEDRLRSAKVDNQVYWLGASNALNSAINKIHELTGVSQDAWGPRGGGGYSEPPKDDIRRVRESETWSEEEPEPSADTVIGLLREILSELKEIHRDGLEEVVS